MGNPEAPQVLPLASTGHPPEAPQVPDSTLATNLNKTFSKWSSGQEARHIYLYELLGNPEAPQVLLLAPTKAPQVPESTLASNLNKTLSKWFSGRVARHIYFYELLGNPEAPQVLPMAPTGHPPEAPQVPESTLATNLNKTFYKWSSGQEARHIYFYELLGTRRPPRYSP